MDIIVPSLDEPGKNKRRERDVEDLGKGESLLQIWIFSWYSVDHHDTVLKSMQELN